MRAGCLEESTRWYEEGDETIHVCTEHDDVSEAEERGDGMIKNGRGEMMELGVYSCSEECLICN